MNFKNCSYCKKKLSIEFFKKKKNGYSKCCIDCLEKSRIRALKNTLKNKDKFLCEDCEYKCANKGYLKKHIKAVHLKIKNFECEKCSYKCATKTSLKNHINAVHDKIKNFECEKCSYKCSSRGNLYQHINTVHDKIKNFECEKCSYKCATKGSLKQHIKRIHLKIKNFKCEDCEYRCFRKGSLYQHINTVHDKIKNFECEKCSYKCSSRGNLTQHIKMIHLKIKNFECEKCSYKCSSRGNLTQHIKMIHLKIKNFKCENCEYKCSCNSNLKRHMKTCTGKMNCSSGEFKIMEILKKLNIQYEYDTSYKVKDISFLRWDFIIELNNKKAFIEYDGIQHYEPTRFGNMTYNKALECYNSTVARDNLKNEFCEENNLKLLRISYLEKKECENLILNFIKNV
jgi:KRAB domain-containing zinc finger protein